MSMSQEEKALAYQVVAARHAGWDNLLWQIPVLSMTAQAFLFSISLSPGSSTVARVIASALSILTLFLSATSMARQRQGALVDAEWLAEQERNWPEIDKQYGLVWMKRRNEHPLNAGWQGRIIPRIAMFKTWIVAFLIFLLADILIITLAIAWPSVLNH